MISHLYERLERRLPRRCRPFLEEWFAGRATYDLELADVSVRPLG